MRSFNGNGSVVRPIPIVHFLFMDAQGGACCNLKCSELGYRIVESNKLGERKRKACPERAEECEECVKFYGRGSLLTSTTNVLSLII